MGSVSDSGAGQRKITQYSNYYISFTPDSEHCATGKKSHGVVDNSRMGNSKTMSNLLSLHPSMDITDEQTVQVCTQRGRKNIRQIKELQELKLNTRDANRQENDRLIRIQNREKKFKEALENRLSENELILDYDFVNNVPLVSVHEALVQKMKSHQREGIKFMWNACYESVEEVKKSHGSGCILAHCMGLGKTFQVIAFVHTLLNHSALQTKNVLICCPKNTLLNWVNEFEKWITPDLGHIDIYNPTRFGNNFERLEEVTKWHRNGGVCIINYELMRILLEEETELEESKTKFQMCLCNPGSDLIICDEGHILRNEETKLSKVMNQIRTMRRIVLTGTPMQNNLIEYHCMIQFVKPNLLGTRNEFVNMFVNPILNGQYENSRSDDVQLMKERSHILYKKLLGCVQRFDLSTLKAYLPEKREYVISIALTESQIQMYRHYLAKYSTNDSKIKNGGVALFSNYQSLQRIWTHPYTLKDFADRYKEEAILERSKSKKNKKRFYDDEDLYEESSEDSFRWSRFRLLWWVRFVTVDEIEDVRQSNKLVILLKIIQKCEEVNEKIVVFSGSLYSLRLIQYFLSKINSSEFEDPCLCNMTSSWEEEQDYLILTGQTSSEDRDRFCRSFNDDSNLRLRLFLISTKAGGMGINLTAASRAILFDASWNPSDDVQSIFRIYRMGQKKPCFLYRFVASGTMEEKIYERQVAKQSISHRVVDEKQIARHYTQKELLELYFFEPNKRMKVKEVEPKDLLLQDLFRDESERIIGVHEHDSLLEHKTEEELQELEKNDAWIAYNNDDECKKLSKAEIEMIFRFKPESFDPEFLRMVLKQEYSSATEEQVSQWMEELMPRVTEILEGPDFIEIMKKQAVYHRITNNSRPQNSNWRKKGKRKSKRNSSESKLQERDQRKGKKNKENSRMGSWNGPGTSKQGCRSDSDSEEDLFFQYDIHKKNKGKRRPLKVWGVRNGRPFGSPEKEY